MNKFLSRSGFILAVLLAASMHARADNYSPPGVMRPNPGPPIFTYPGADTLLGEVSQESAEDAHDKAAALAAPRPGQVSSPRPVAPSKPAPVPRPGSAASKPNRPAIPRPQTVGKPKPRPAQSSTGTLPRPAQTTGRPVAPIVGNPNPTNAASPPTTAGPGRGAFGYDNNAIKTPASGSSGSPAPMGADTRSPGSRQQALRDERAMLIAKRAELLRWDGKAKENFQRWFGTIDPKARALILTRINLALAMNQNFSATNLVPAPASDPDRFAYVNTQDPSRIYLDQQYFQSPATGPTSRAGTLIHEMSHFFGTHDYAYGEQSALSLASGNSRLALQNADNFEFFLEGATTNSTPLLRP